MTAQAGQQIITIHALPNIPRGKGNQAIKYSHLIKYSMMNIFSLKMIAEDATGS